MEGQLEITFTNLRIKNMLRKWVFAANSIVLIPKSLQPDGVDLYYFKLRLFDLPKTKIWNFKGQRNRVVNIMD